MEPDLLMTKVQPMTFNPKITYKDTIALVGSCFTEHISQKLMRYKYSVLNNPFGILYNPVSIAVSFERIARQELYQKDELIFQDGMYHSMDHHGLFSGPDQDIVLSTINKEIENAALRLADRRFVFISLGSAKVHRLKKTGCIAGNCHKIPQTEFESFRLSLSECISAVERSVNAIHQMAPSAHIIWTVSPVKHLRDGLEENQRSKATLLLAIDHRLKEAKNDYYFPAYEMMLDQLRDYRYYDRDLTHPSSLAIDLIWEMFVDTFMDPHERDIHSKIEKIHRATEHRIMHDNHEMIKSFAVKQLDSISDLETLYPDLDWEKERNYFSQLIENS